MILTLAAFILALLFLWFWRLEYALNSTPPEALALSPRRWTVPEILDTFSRISKKPVDVRPHLPPAQDRRRYIVVGGSGLVGGAIVLLLLARGQNPKSIRIIDFKPTIRKDLLAKGKDVQFIKADVTDEASIRSAFAAPWSDGLKGRVALTVFHTAAVIHPGDRIAALQDKMSRVNVVGTAHVLATAKASGADVFIATSSASISVRPCGYWMAPWRTYPVNYFQIYPDPATDNNLRDRSEYAGNYSVSKAHAEDLVLKANGKDFMTGTVRPACGIYGERGDLTVGSYMKMAAETEDIFPT
jgi:nucleoside-diphosphate-sugar epimerase